jgi:predicted transcriptional regulator
MDRIFAALAHSDRRAILDIVKSNPGCNVRLVSEQFDTSRIAVLKHINVLEKADLLITERAGRERKLYFNAVPIQQIYDRWTTEFSALWARDLTRLKYNVETKREES